MYKVTTELLQQYPTQYPKTLNQSLCFNPQIGEPWARPKRWPSWKLKCLCQNLSTLRATHVPHTVLPLDDHSKVVPLLPISNRTVKHLSADDSGWTSVKVGHRQALIPQTPGAIYLPGGSALLASVFDYSTLLQTVTNSYIFKFILSFNLK